MYTTHLEYVTQLGVLPKVATHRLLPLCARLCALSWMHCTQTNSEQIGRDARKIHISGRKEKHPTLKLIENLDINRYMDMRKYCNAKFTKRWLKEVVFASPPAVVSFGAKKQNSVPLFHILTL